MYRFGFTDHKQKYSGIETKHRGNTFRSRLEARWAEFFFLCGIKFMYEPEYFHGHYGRINSGYGYTPDFRVPYCGREIYRSWVFVEIKPTLEAREESIEKFGLIRRDNILVTFVGDPPGIASFVENHKGVTSRPQFAACNFCGKIRLALSNDAKCLVNSQPYSTYDSIGEKVDWHKVECGELRDRDVVDRAAEVACDLRFDDDDFKELRNE